MIKQTFYNLPEHKRNNIIEVILNEFSNSNCEKVSINKIIKTANISRGSFYQYFDDKVDLVEVITRHFIETSLEKTYNAIQSANGDIFLTYIKMFDTITGLASDAKQRKIIKNLFKNFRTNDNLISEYLNNRFKENLPTDELYEYFNKKQLKFKDDTDIKLLLDILTQVLKNSAFKVFILDRKIDDVKKVFLRQIEIIKSGATMEENYVI